MCCFPSVVLVLFGLASVSSAAALSNDLYWGTNGMWWFRPLLMTVSALLIGTGLVLYFRKDGICSLDEVKRQRKRIVNTSLLVFTLSIITYIVFNFIILTEIGVALNLLGRAAACGTGSGAASLRLAPDAPIRPNSMARSRLLKKSVLWGQFTRVCWGRGKAQMVVIFCPIFQSEFLNFQLKFRHHNFQLEFEYHEG